MRVSVEAEVRLPNGERKTIQVKSEYVQDYCADTWIHDNARAVALDGFSHVAEAYGPEMVIHYIPSHMIDRVIAKKANY